MPRPFHLRSSLATCALLALTVGGFAVPRLAGDAVRLTAEGRPEASIPPASFLRLGEALQFRLSWGFFSNSGTTRIATQPVIEDGKSRVKVHIVTKSRGVVNTLFPVLNDASSLIDPATARPIAIIVNGQAGKRKTSTETRFDYAKHEVRHTDTVKPDRNATTPLPAEPAYDLMVAALRTRAWNLKVGEARTIQISSAGEFYSVEVTAIAESKVKTPAGEFDAVVLEPKQLGEPKGFFKKGGALKIWVSRGEKPQVVRFDTKTIAGMVSAVLEKESTVEELPVEEQSTSDAAPE